MLILSIIVAAVAFSACDDDSGIAPKPDEGYQVSWTVSGGITVTAAVGGVNIANGSRVDGGDNVRFEWAGVTIDYVVEVMRGNEVLRTVTGNGYWTLSNIAADQNITFRAVRNSFTTITAAAANTMMGELDAFVIVDTRSASAFISGRLVGAVSIPEAQLAARAAAELPDKQAIVFIYGQTAADSVRAAQILGGLLYQNVYVFGGFADWNYDTAERCGDTPCECTVTVRISVARDPGVLLGDFSWELRGENNQLIEAVLCAEQGVFLAEVQVGESLRIRWNHTIQVREVAFQSNTYSGRHTFGNPVGVRQFERRVQIVNGDLLAPVTIMFRAVF